MILMMLNKHRTNYSKHFLNQIFIGGITAIFKRTNITYAYYCKISTSVLNNIFEHALLI